MSSFFFMFETEKGSTVAGADKAINQQTTTTNRNTSFLKRRHPSFFFFIIIFSFVAVCFPVSLLKGTKHQTKRNQTKHHQHHSYACVFVQVCDHSSSSSSLYRYYVPFCKIEDEDIFTCYHKVDTIILTLTNDDVFEQC